MAHTHAHAHPVAEKRLLLSLVLVGIILLAEVLGGLWTHSLALLSDAAHVFLDMIALVVSYGAIRLSARPPDDRHTYGFHRLKVLAALLNGATLLIVAFGIFREAWERFGDPAPVLAGPMLAIAVVGLVVNLVVALVLREHDHDDLNVRSAFLHVLGDALASVGVIVAAVVILFTGWTLIDPIASVLIGAIIAFGSIPVLRESLNILTEGAPEGVSAAEVRATMAAVSGVSEIHDLHVWAVSPGYVALSAHVIVEDQTVTQAEHIVNRLKTALSERFSIDHVTIQVECMHCGQGMPHCA